MHLWTVRFYHIIQMLFLINILLWSFLSYSWFIQTSILAFFKRRRSLISWRLWHYFHIIIIFIFYYRRDFSFCFSKSLKRTIFICIWGEVGLLMYITFQYFLQYIFNLLYFWINTIYFFVQLFAKFFLLLLHLYFQLLPLYIFIYKWLVLIEMILDSVLWIEISVY